MSNPLSLHVSGIKNNILRRLVILLTILPMAAAGQVLVIVVTLLFWLVNAIKAPVTLFKSAKERW